MFTHCQFFLHLPWEDAAIDMSGPAACSSRNMLAGPLRESLGSRKKKAETSDVYTYVRTEAGNTLL